MARIDNVEHRAVYHLVSTGQMTVHVVPLYKRQLNHLADMGVIRRREDGAYEVIDGDAVKGASTPPPKRPSAPPAAPEPKAEPMGTLVARVPQAWIDLLDSMGPTRSEAARVLLGKALAHASGARLRKAQG